MNFTNEMAQKWVESLNLLPHPEGGFYQETYRCSETIKSNYLPERFEGERSYSTSIYFLLRGHECSHLHRLCSDEVWHFYDGVALNIYIIHPAGNLEIIRLGKNIESGEKLQAVVPAGVWFGAKPVIEDGYSLTGCTMAPGFDFNDFELGNRKELLTSYPHLKDLINQFALNG